MEEHAQWDVLLDDVGREPRAEPVRPPWRNGPMMAVTVLVLVLVQGLFSP
jgi:hypothetical protein